jgi:hypothetical protein
MAAAIRPEPLQRGPSRGDVDWVNNRLTVRSPKTEYQEAKSLAFSQSSQNCALTSTTFGNWRRKQFWPLSRKSAQKSISSPAIATPIQTCDQLERIIAKAGLKTVAEAVSESSRRQGHEARR